jgi:hypothetical protein
VSDRDLGAALAGMAASRAVAARVAKVAEVTKAWNRKVFMAESLMTVL